MFFEALSQVRTVVCADEVRRLSGQVRRLFVGFDDGVKVGCDDHHYCHQLGCRMSMFSQWLEHMMANYFNLFQLNVYRLLNSQCTIAQSLTMCLLCEGTSTFMCN